LGFESSAPVPFFAIAPFGPASFAAQWSAEFSWSAAAQRYEELYRSLVRETEIAA